jgi:hypothetical protein
MVGRPRLSAREDHPELQLCDGVSLFRQWGEQRQCTTVVALGVGHERVGQRVARTLLRLVKRLGTRLERPHCSLAPGERGQQYPSVDVGDHFAPPSVAFRDIRLTFRELCEIYHAAGDGKTNDMSWTFCTGSFPTAWWIWKTSTLPLSTERASACAIGAAKNVSFTTAQTRMNATAITCLARMTAPWICKSYEHGSAGIRDANPVPESAATLPPSREIELLVGAPTERFMPRLQ